MSSEYKRLKQEYTLLLSKLQPIDPNAIPVPIYYINLNSALMRKQFIETQLNLYNTSYTRVPAFDGNISTKVKPSVWKIDSCYVQNSISTEPKKLACTLSHIKAIEQAYKDEHPWALICEDDAFFGLSGYWPLKQLRNFMTEANVSGIGIIQLYWAQRNHIEQTIYKARYILKQTDNPCWGTVAYLISRKGMQKILSYSGSVASSDMDHPVFIDPKLQQDMQDGLFYGVADHFLYRIVPTALTTKPMVGYGDFVSSIERLVPQSAARQLRAPVEILKMYLSNGIPEEAIQSCKEIQKHEKVAVILA